MRKYFALSSLAMAVLLSSCALQDPPAGKTLHDQAFSSSAQVPASFYGAYGSVDAQHWAETFQSPELLSLIDEAQRNNPDLRISAARVEAAQAMMRMAQGGLLPSVNFLMRGKNDSSGLQGGLLKADWELDVWGRVRSEVRASSYAKSAYEADLAGARLSLAANVTQAWLLLVEANTQQQLAQKSAELADKWAALAQTRQQIGAENGSYVAQAKSLAASYHQQVASIEQAKRAATQALERLIGRYPATQLQVTTILPKLPELPNAGFPLGLLERRPDVISAERRVAEAFDRVASAQAARLPRLSLTGTGSNFVSKVFELQNSGVTQWGLGGTVLVPIFQGGALLAQVDVQKANQKAALAFYASTALNAFTDVERALSNEKGLTQQAKQQAVQLESAGKQLQYAQSRTAIGKDSQIGLLQQQLAWYAEKAASVRLQSAQLTQRVSTHLAIGGSFSNKNYPELELEGDASAPVSK